MCTGDWWAIRACTPDHRQAWTGRTWSFSDRGGDLTWRPPWWMKPHETCNELLACQLMTCRLTSRPRKPRMCLNSLTLIFACVTPLGFHAVLTFHYIFSRWDGTEHIFVCLFVSVNLHVVITTSMGGRKSTVCGRVEGCSSWSGRFRSVV